MLFFFTLLKITFTFEPTALLPPHTPFPQRRRRVKVAQETGCAHLGEYGLEVVPLLCPALCLRRGIGEEAGFPGQCDNLGGGGCSELCLGSSRGSREAADF